MLEDMESLAAESKKKPSFADWEKANPGISNAGCISFQQFLPLVAGQGEAFKIFKNSFEITEFLNSCLKTQ